MHSWLPHGALNGSNGWTHNLEAREFANDTAICGLQHNCREQIRTVSAVRRRPRSSGTREGMCAGALPIRSVVVSRGFPTMGIESSEFAERVHLRRQA